MSNKLLIRLSILNASFLFRGFVFLRYLLTFINSSSFPKAMLLSKTKYIAGLSCPKYLWMLEYDKDKIPELNETALFTINQGHAVGQLAKELYPEGIDIPEGDFSANLTLSKEYLSKKKPLFEAAFLVDNLYARADILVPKGKKWDIVEVKSSTSVKEDHVHDVSFQKHVYEKFGLVIHKCYLAHINKEFVKKGKIKAKDILVVEDISQEVEEASVGIQERIAGMFHMLSQKEAPDVSIGNGCKNGLNCPSEDCWSFLPEGHVFELYYGGKKSTELLEGEILCLKDIPDNFKLTERQAIQKECARTGKVHVEKKKIKEFLDSFQEPVHYFDFETFATAIPLLDGTKPYEKIPFQFSCDIVEKGKIKHVEFLHKEASDPRKALVDALHQCFGEKGSIVTYNQSFEISVLKDLGKLFPLEKKWLDAVIARIVDLAVPFRNFWYYHPQQKGKYSIKYVMPVLTGKGYADLEISRGDLAYIRYLDVTWFAGAGKEKVYRDLLAYCGQDSAGMAWIVERLMEVIE